MTKFKLSNEEILRRLKKNFGDDIEVGFPEGNAGSRTIVEVRSPTGDFKRGEFHDCFERVKTLKSPKAERFDYEGDILSRLPEGFRYLGKRPQSSSEPRPLKPSDKFFFRGADGTVRSTTWNNQKKNGFKFTNCELDVDSAAEFAKRRLGSRGIDAVLSFRGASAASSRLSLRCRACGYEWSVPLSQPLYQDSGCKKCAGKLPHTQREFLDAARKAHPFDDLSEAVYEGSNSKVKVICHVLDRSGLEHGAFYPVAGSYVRGSGCPKCASSALEDEARSALDAAGIRYEPQKTFGGDRSMRFDFFVPEAGAAVECQGAQHYRPVRFFGGDDGFSKRRASDARKLEFCRSRGIRMLYFDHSSADSFLGVPVLHSVENLVEALGLPLPESRQGKPAKVSESAEDNIVSRGMRFSSPEEWRTLDSKSFRAAKALGLLRSVFPEGRWRWTEAEFSKAAAECGNSSSVLMRENPAAYAAGVKHGWIRKRCSVKKKRVRVSVSGSPDIFCVFGGGKAEAGRALDVGRSAVGRAMETGREFRGLLFEDAGSAAPDASALPELRAALRKRFSGIVSFFPDGAFAGEFESLKAAAGFAGTSPQNILRCCGSERSSCAGRRWMRADEWGGAPLPPAGAFVPGEHLRKAVRQLDLGGNFIALYESESAAARSVASANRSGIARCCEGRQRTCGGFRWAYE